MNVNSSQLSEARVSCDFLSKPIAQFHLQTMSTPSRKRDYNGELKECPDLCCISRPTRITDLSDEFLNQILRHLRLEDLANVADVNERFNRLVYTRLKKKWKGKAVSIFCSAAIEWLCLAGAKGKFWFKTPSITSRFFERFGHMISHIAITLTNDCTKNRFEEIGQVMFKHCGESLTKIEITSSLMPMELQSLPFAEEVHLNQCKLDGTLSRKLPSVRRLVLNECEAIDPKCIEAYFQSLDELTVIGKRKRRHVFNAANIKEVLRLNSQIRRLDINFNSTNDREAGSNHPDFELNVDFYRYVSETLPRLESLEMYGDRNFAPDQCNEEIDFWQLEQLSIHYIFKKDPSDIVPFTFRRLSELKLHDLTELSDDWIRFISRNADLQKLTIGMDYDYVDKKLHIDRDQLLKIVKWLPKLKELHLSAESIEPSDVVAIIAKRKSLTTIHLQNYTELDWTVGTLDQLTALKKKHKWLVDYDSQDIILSRY